MKKFIYSNYTKVTAVILFVAFITAGILIGINGIVDLHREENIIYRFENDFYETDYFQSMLHSTEAAVFSAFCSLYDQSDEGTRQEIQNSTEKIDFGLIKESIERELNYLYCKEEVDYFVKINDAVFTNCGATDKADLSNKEFFYIVFRNSEGMVDRNFSNSSFYIRPSVEEISKYDNSCDITIATSIKSDYLAQCKATWEKQALILNNMVIYVLACLIGAFLVLVYLLCVCGKTSLGEQKNIWIDNIWLEIHLIVIVGFVLITVAVCIFLLEEKFFLQPFMNLIIGSAAGISFSAVITSLLSVVRNIKCRRLAKTSIILRFAKRFIAIVYSGVKGAIKLIAEVLSQKTSAIYLIMFFIYTAIILFCGLGMTDDLGRYDHKWIIYFALVTLAVAFVVVYRAKDLESIKKGISEIRNGNLTYKIPCPKSSDMKMMAENVNDIAKGLDDSVSAKLKAEQMKTELITNVSHDLKTPLTSIINYTELLAKMEDLPEEANDYIKVIAAKSDRLKTLTQDLFDISKVQSGNETVDLEKLDVSLLINQSLGEYNGEIENSRLAFCVDTPKELYINADGKKMSRVLSNLINNILKYSMKNTRVFIKASEINGDVIMEFKNISSYPMDFSAEEIAGRFVRGDESRTADGNGLGLAIAKSYTEICNGRLDIIIDGDMFKVLLKFKKYS